MQTVVDLPTLSALLGLPHWAIRQIQASGGDFAELGPEAAIREGATDVLPPEWQRLSNGHIECPSADLADCLGVTIQRINQLAAISIVVKTRHGYCDATESCGRYVAYRKEEAERAAIRAGSRSPIRDEAYWRARARERGLRYGWTASEVLALFALIEALRQSVVALQARAGSGAKTRSASDRKTLVSAITAVSERTRDLCEFFLDSEEQAKVHGGWLLNDANQAA